TTLNSLLSFYLTTFNGENCADFFSCIGDFSLLSLMISFYRECL
ncbi:MAG: hypothetical protein ACI9ES_002620, partial [Oceanospirillaceae bacterium]